MDVQTASDFLAAEYAELQMHKSATPLCLSLSFDPDDGVRAPLLLLPLLP